MNVAMDKIIFEENPYHCFSNFSAHAIDWKGIRFPTTEHVYHWERFVGEDDLQALIIGAKSPREAWRIAQENKEKQLLDWNDKKVLVMKNILTEKLRQHTEIQTILKQTGSAEIIKNVSTDAFWGCGAGGNGENMMGKMWMELREEMI